MSAAFRRPSTSSLVDLGVLAVLSVIGVLGFETAYGGANFLLGACFGILVGIGAGLLAFSLRLGVLTTTLTGLLAYLLLGSLTMPGQAIAVLVPTPETLAGLVIGPVFGWADILTVQTPVEAPYYVAVVPYFAAWLVGFVGAVLTLVWLPRRRGAVRAAVILIGPVLLYLCGILLGTREPVFAAVRGIVFAVIALAWIGWRMRSTPTSTSPEAARRLRTSRLIGIGSVIAGAVVIGLGSAVLTAPPAAARFVLRDEIVPPFDPVDFSSPLAGFRKYTKVMRDDTVFTAMGLQAGDRIRLASMDAYTGRLWNVAGPEDSAKGDGGFEIVGSTLPAPDLATVAGRRDARITVKDYDDVWMPSVGYPRGLHFDDADSEARRGDIRYNPDSGTAVLTSGLHAGNSYDVTAEVQREVDAGALEKVPVARIEVPAVEDVPDVLVAKAVEFAGDATTPIDRLANIEKALKSRGFLSHGLASDAVASRAGHGADRMSELFTRSQMVGDEEQYASAMALMARHFGYPARVVMGFAPEITDGSPVNVKGSDVTAWVEVPFEGVGWVPFFPTPDQTDVPQDQVPKPKSQPQPQVRQPPRNESADDQLLTTVDIDKSDDKKKKPPIIIPAWVWVTAAVLGIPLLVLLVPLGIAALRKAVRRRRRERAPSADRRAAGAWTELTDRLEEIGLTVPAPASRRQVAAALEQQCADEGLAKTGSAVGLTTLADEVDRTVFNGEDVPAEQVEQQWRNVDAAVAAVYLAAGPLRRFVARYRVRHSSPRKPR
ncbi:transglutaminase domain-containing protein [Rathayibacter sp. YIM 133350]|uniref:transglutaminase domain-containing protein n=1 Tax=Rathayibacter sp. YIM 133350 TaxID=3131992 RepID=UPI00307F86C1